MEKDPSNEEANADLKTTRALLEKEGKSKGFKKINIVEEEDDEDEE